MTMRSLSARAANPVGESRKSCATSTRITPIEPHDQTLQVPPRLWLRTAEVGRAMRAHVGGVKRCPKNDRAGCSQTANPLMERSGGLHVGSSLDFAGRSQSPPSFVRARGDAPRQHELLHGPHPEPLD